ncbi:MAG: hypothetical protein EXR72_11090 [Myxococcales bacterium]|nr:hypothetical protein [Myxococcales bacterium]
MKVLEERVAALEKVRAAAEAPVPAPMAAKSWAEPPGMPQGGAEKASVATIVAPPAENPAPTPVYRKWWLWTAVAALVVVAGGFAIAVASWPRDAQVPQSGLGATEVGFH